MMTIRTLGTEYFNYDETRHALIGSRSGAMHRLGDVVDVRLVEAAPVAGALRFELLSEGQTIPRGRKRDGFKAPTKARPGRSPRDKRVLEVGRDIPTPNEIKRMIAAAKGGKRHALLLVAALSGLRASELRGLRWKDVDLKAGELHVRQRADRYGG